MKIGPVDPEIALLNLKEKKLMHAKYYSPVGRFAEWAILSINQSFICQNKNKDTTSRTQRLRQH